MSLQDHVITLLISCPDRPGIVAALSQFIFTHGGNIIQSDQHATERHGGTFFMRISFAEEEFNLNDSELHDAFRPLAETFEMQWSINYSRRRKRAAILVSKLDHCFTDVLWRWKSGELDVEIACIISNHPDLEPQ